MLRSFSQRMDRPQIRLGKQRSVNHCCSFCDDEEEEYCIANGEWSRKMSQESGSGSGNWWKKGWNSVRRAGEWSESLMEEAGNRSGPKWRLFVRRLRSIYPRKPLRSHYDEFSYALNFDEGSWQESDDLYHSSSARFAPPLQKARVF
ncbi:hypothetical protein SUGI_0279130 [Cryptomeria japonica]|uniref:uncharacterized protein LOC131075664 n=1 Tax=Cryptomeria japonica TaxID=3369 RepID=UPI002408B0B4|nr:uncharacterized protein LOC131075664 [Cryptomeria japonica]GLJ16427.1 hypothetical protein SUGI_0279130 [Cryptomeria japonica]